jgi:hypothetical protein
MLGPGVCELLIAIHLNEVGGPPSSHPHPGIAHPGVGTGNAPRPYDDEASYETDYAKEKYSPYINPTPLVVYHGSTNKVAMQIYKNGIKPSGRYSFGNFTTGDMDDMGVQDLSHGDYVHVTSKLEQAQRYADEVASKKNHQAQLFGTGDKFKEAVFKITIPPGYQLRADNHDYEGLLFKGTIPSKWVDRTFTSGGKRWTFGYDNKYKMNYIEPAHESAQGTVVYYPCIIREK